MKTTKSFLSLFLLFLFGLSLSQSSIKKLIIPADLEKLVILQPSGEMIDDLPEMLILSDTSQLYQHVMKIANNSFIVEVLDLYFLAQVYLKNKNELTTIEPAYLALTENMGGFAKVGFIIKQGNEHIKKEDVPYIDIVADRISRNQDHLMSVTQLYPHEMGHVIYGLLSSSDTSQNNYRSVDMHYFSVRTDYPIAFNEGFAEHIENVSRIFEKNETIKTGIFADIEKIKKRSEFAISGFEKDFLYPFRFGYYKMSMANWYQKYENLKRYDHVINGTVRYQNATLDIGNIEDQLTFKNTGARQNTNELLNYVQMLSTEGVISAFFTHLTNSDLKNHYLDSSFYIPFLVDTTISIKSPEKFFTPLQNQFLKYFVVFHNHLCNNYSKRSQFIDFIEGYISLFPSEKEAVKKIFKDVTNLEYTAELPPEIWLLVKDHRHRLMVMDPFGAITMPVYTFDLNGAEVEDLLTIKDLQKEEAIKIIEYRKANGFFSSLDQIKNIPGISDESMNNILNCEFDQKYFKEIPKPDLNFYSLIWAPLKNLFIRALIYFVIIFTLIYFFFLYREKPEIKRTLVIMLRHFLLWLLLVIVGFALVFLSDRAWLFFISLDVVIMLISLFIYRKDKRKRWRSLFAACLMGLIILLSII